jgi:hypothetical protein
VAAGNPTFAVNTGDEIVNRQALTAMTSATDFPFGNIS